MKKLIRPLLLICFWAMSLIVIAQPGNQKTTKTEHKKVDSFNPDQYVGVIEVSLNKNVYVDVKGSTPLSVDVGGEKSAVLLAIQDNSNIIKMKAQKKNFTETNMIIVCTDTVLQFVVRYIDKPTKTLYQYEMSAIKKQGQENRNKEYANINPDNSKSLNQISTQGVINSNNTNQATNGKKNVWRDSSATVDVAYGIEQRQQLGNKNTNGNASTGLAIKETTKATVAEVKKEESGEKKLAVDEPLSTGKYLREEVFEKLRSKSINTNLGDLDGGVRVVLDRLYQDGDIFYYALTIYNREKSDFSIDYSGFEVHRKGLNQSTNTDIIKSYQPKNNPTVITAGSKSSLVFSTDKVEMLPEEFLMLNITGGEKEIKIKLKQVDYKRASNFSL